MPTAKKRKEKEATLAERLPRIGRDSVLFFAGLGGIFHETIIAKVERPYLLMVFVSMVGLPAFLRGDEKKTESKDDGE